MKRNSVRFDDSGWTFVETVVTLAIVLTLSSATGVTAYRYLESARVAKVMAELTAITVALDSYNLDCGSYPTTDQGLLALWEPPHLHPVPAGWRGPYLSTPLERDPWGRPYVYRRLQTGARPYELYSSGPPGEERRLSLQGAEG
ncbi:MAG: type II secretion system major pseudopilin GspG [Alkalispirochaetaceae bacterium]